MTILPAIGLGLLIGLSLGALGGGGSVLTVPALVYGLGESPRAATAASLVIIGVTSLAGAVDHARDKQIRVATGAVFGSVGVLTSYAGAALSRQVDANALLLAFAALMVVAATAMLRPIRSPIQGAVTRRDPRATAKMVGAGLVVGFLTGLFGVGGGFVIVPALVMALGYTMPVAVGTSLLIIAINSATSLGVRAGTEAFDWALIAPLTAAAIGGSFAGRYLAGRLSSRVVTTCFATLLYALAIYVAVRSGYALLS